MATLSSRKKRFLIALPLGVLAGLICTWLASSSTPDIWGTALMWTIIANRWTIGLVIGLAGVYTKHPVFDFPIPSYFRGFMLGMAVSLSLAAGAMMSPDTSWMIFWGSVVMGGIYGSIIDILATRYGGEGKVVI